MKRIIVTLTAIMLFLVAFWIGVSMLDSTDFHTKLFATIATIGGAFSCIGLFVSLADSVKAEVHNVEIKRSTEFFKKRQSDLLDDWQYIVERGY